jgi:uncharacterized protein YbjQ (UPF0145 family)
MTENDIVTVAYVDGKRIIAYLGTVFASADSYERMINMIVEQGQSRGASMVINFQITILGFFYGQGTAVRVENK